MDRRHTGIAGELTLPPSKAHVWWSSIVSLLVKMSPSNTPLHSLDVGAELTLLVAVNARAPALKVNT